MHFRPHCEKAHEEMARGRRWGRAGLPLLDNRSVDWKAGYFIGRAQQDARPLPKSGTWIVKDEQGTLEEAV